jgi:hypothetical protein
VPGEEHSEKNSGEPKERVTQESFLECRIVYCCCPDVQKARRRRHLSSLGHANYHVVPPQYLIGFYRISLRTCEKVAENGGPGAPFSAPFPPKPNSLSGRFNLFLGPGAPSAQRASCRLFLTFSTQLPSPSLPSSEGPNFAPRALSLKWTFLHLLCALWLAVYTRLCRQSVFVLAL